MISSVLRIFSVPELRKKILFTLLMLTICRVGAYIPVPGINGDLAVELDALSPHVLEGNVRTSIEAELDLELLEEEREAELEDLADIAEIRARTRGRLARGIVPSMQ